MKISRRIVLPAMAAAATVPFASAQVKRLKPSSGIDQSKVLQAAIDEAVQGGGVLRLPAGTFIASGLKIGETVVIEGVAGHTRIVSADGRPAMQINSARGVTLRGVMFDGGGKPVPQDMERVAIVMAEDAEALAIEDCGFANGAASGLVLTRCSGRVVHCRFDTITQAALFALDSTGLMVRGNDVRDIGNNGILVWTTEKREDGTIVCENRVARIAAKDGGSGQNGNGINIYKAGNVIVSNNRVSDCAYSAIRNNSGNSCQIVNNAISRTAEVAIYVEFAFEGAVVSGNMIEDVGFGISMANLDQGGRLAVCSGNVVRNAQGSTTEGVKNGGGIYAEADTAISGNTIENARDVGIALGWGPYCRDLSATGNVIRSCGKGITASLTEGAGAVMVANNIISGSKVAAIMGMDHAEPVSGDLGQAGAEVPDRIRMSGNLILP